MTRAGGAPLGSRYTLEEPVSAGAMGEVWRARDNRSGGQVAAKLLKEHHEDDPEVIARFINERKLLLAVDHPGVVGARDMVVEGDTLAIIMDLVEGPDLAALLREHGPLAEDRAAAVGAGVLGALAAAHRAGIVHRDVKPSNVLITHPDAPTAAGVRLVDFGIAALAAQEPDSERIGTPAYMAPEVDAGGRATPAADVYSAGVVLYEMLSGEPPRAAAGADCGRAPRLPIDDALWDLVAHMLAEDPDARPSAAACLRALGRLAPPVGDAAPGADGPPGADDERWVPSAAPADADTGRAAGTIHDEMTIVSSRKCKRPAAVEDEAPGVDLAEPEGDETILKPGFHHYVVGPEPTDTGTAEAKPKRWILWCAVAAVCAIAVGAGAWMWLGGRSGTTDEDPYADLSIGDARTTGDFSATGLRVDTSATWDKDVKRTILTLTYSVAPRVTVSGEVLVVLPGVHDGKCAAPSDAKSALQPIKASTDGMSVPCGYRIVLAPVAYGQQQVVSLPVDLDLVGEDGSAPADYSQWLAAVDSATASALSTMTGTRFPLQRVTGISVKPESVSLDGTEATPVPYTVTATWNGKADGTTETDLVSSETRDGAEIQALLDLTGGQGLDGLTLTTCSSARVSGTRVLAEQPTDSCDLEAQIGGLSSPKASFQARMRNS